MGGSARVWQTILPADLLPASAVQLRLVMTKFGPPAVRIAYAAIIEPAS